MPSRTDVEAVYRLPMKALIFRAAESHSRSFGDDTVKLASLLSIKTGGCPENCAYCPQSAHYRTGVTRRSLLSVGEVLAAAQTARASGASRFCMGAAWREVRNGPDFDHVIEVVREVSKLGLEVCCTLGMIEESQARRLKDAGLHAYNHNIDTSRSYYERIVSTRHYDDRLKTIEGVRRAGLTVCTGGIIGMGESEEDRVDFLHQLSSFDPHPESVTINSLIPVEGTPLQSRSGASALELARVIATARCLMPRSVIRLSAGRKGMTDEGQFLCFLAGANSIFLGETLLTSPNPGVATDRALFEKLGLGFGAGAPGTVEEQVTR